MNHLHTPRENLLVGGHVSVRTEVDEYDAVKRIHPRTVNEFLGVDTKRTPVISGLVDAGCTVHAISTDDVRVQTLAMHVAVCVAAGADFGVFKVPNALKTLYVSGLGEKGMDQLRLDKILSTLTPTQAEAAQKNLVLYNREMECDEAIELNTSNGQNIFSRSIPEDVGFIVFDDVTSFASVGVKSNHYSMSEMKQWAKEQNHLGFTFMWFRKPVVARETHTEREDMDTLLLKQDSVPSDMNPGILFERKRHAESDSLPKIFTYSHLITDNHFEYEFSYLDPSQPSEADHIKDAKLLVKIYVGAMRFAGIKNLQVAKHLEISAVQVSKHWKAVQESPRLMAEAQHLARTPKFLEEMKDANPALTPETLETLETWETSEIQKTLETQETQETLQVSANSEKSTTATVLTRTHSKLLLPNPSVQLRPRSSYSFSPSHPTKHQDS